MSTRLDWKACLEKQRRQSGPACVTTACQVSRTACLKAGGGSFGQLEHCSSECQSVAQTDQGERSTRLGWTGMFRWHVWPCQQGKKHVSGVAGLKLGSIREGQLSTRRVVKGMFIEAT